MKISYCRYTLELTHQFTIAYNSRKSTPVILVRIESGGITGYGEASLPPYLPETQDTAIQFLQKAAKLNYDDLSDPGKILPEIDSLLDGNTSAKAALDIALYDLAGKLAHYPCCQLFGIPNVELPYTSFTIGIDDPEIMISKIAEAGEFKILKVKLGTEKDRELIKLIRSVTNKPLYVDINQGWQDVNEALDLACWLNEQNVLIIEQPFKKEDLASSEWLTARSPIPIIADESVQRFSDIDIVKNSFHGINIKLMKCTGLNEAHRMIRYGRALGLKIMLGCMTETSCGISAAVQLAGLADYLDLDGNQLIKNDPFEGLVLSEGRIVSSGEEGLGIRLTDALSFTALAEK